MSTGKNSLTSYGFPTNIHLTSLIFFSLFLGYAQQVPQNAYGHSTDYLLTYDFKKRIKETITWFAENCYK
ncbi:CLUMA_CG013481, isoform A [Clunio marinus]|uniref:CLUMA_CG013481, isoform A n=1 Tax=Clunio marinus TaxID=568069 RepID=A0A1J1IIY8_9DIPT|nr:CLUMA_CG013481, isoform A [Clunio marinus]